jgi:hypothetical protein
MGKTTIKGAIFRITEGKGITGINVLFYRIIEM